MDRENHVSLVRQYVEAVNTGNLEVLADLFAADYVHHIDDRTEIGPTAMRSFVASVQHILSDIIVEVIEIVAYDDKVGVRLTTSGTWTKSGRRVTIPEIQIYRIADKKIAERWFVADRSELR